MASASSTKNGTGGPADQGVDDLRNLALSYLAGGVSLVPC